MTIRGLSRIALCVLLWSGFASCIDLVELPEPVDTKPDAGPGGTGGTDGGGGTGGTDGGCTPTTEVCDGIDNDCDGDDDEEDPDAQAYCEGVVVNSFTSCGEAGDEWVCIPGGCKDDFHNCDGEHSNGCEPFCSCNECPDAGSDDAGADDAGQ